MNACCRTGDCAIEAIKKRYISDHGISLTTTDIRRSLELHFPWRRPQTSSPLSLVCKALHQAFKDACTRRTISFYLTEMGLEAGPRWLKLQDSAKIRKLRQIKIMGRWDEANLVAYVKMKSFLFSLTRRTSQPVIGFGYPAELVVDGTPRTAIRRLPYCIARRAHTFADAAAREIDWQQNATITPAVRDFLAAAADPRIVGEGSCARDTCNAFEKVEPAYMLI